ncbi:MAG TPA: 2'-5' RNA ligase family protein [Gemmatirosa sp.]
MPGANGVFIIAPVAGPASARIAEVQRRYDAKLAAESAPHVTLVGSSGTGPIDPGVSRERVRVLLEPVLADAHPLVLPFGAPERFPGTNVVALPLSPHGPIRELHDRIVDALARGGIPTARGRFTFTPHATLSFYPTLPPARLRELLAMRFADPAVLEQIEVSYTKAPQPPVTWWVRKLGAEDGEGRVGGWGGGAAS